MGRRTSTLLSLGVSTALVALGIWLLCNNDVIFAYKHPYWRMSNRMMMGGSGMGVIMIIFWIIFIVAIALVVSGLLSGRRSEGTSATESANTALEILQQRYARGEINKPQYEAMRRDLLS
jgi:putative membrane protein